MTLLRRQTACGMRHCCARRIVECRSRRKLVCTSTRSAKRQRIIEAEANRLATPNAAPPRAGSAIGKHCSSLSCSLAMEIFSGRVKGRDISFQKEISLPYTLPEKIFIASEQLEELRCLPIALLCARCCRVSIARRFASASTIRYRSAHLVEVRSNHRLPPVSSMRRAQQRRIWHTVCRRVNVTRASR